MPLGVPSVIIVAFNSDSIYFRNNHVFISNGWKFAAAIEWMQFAVISFIPAARSSNLDKSSYGMYEKSVSIVLLTGFLPTACMLTNPSLGTFRNVANALSESHFDPDIFFLNKTRITEKNWLRSLRLKNRFKK